MEKVAEKYFHLDDIIISGIMWFSGRVNLNQIVSNLDLWLDSLSCSIVHLADTWLSYGKVKEAGHDADQTIPFYATVKETEIYQVLGGTLPEIWTFINKTKKY